MNEYELIQKFRDGDHAAFKEIFHLTYRRTFFIITNAIGTYHNQDAEDMVIKIMLALYNRRKSFETMRSVRAFLLVCATNAAKNYLIKKEVVYDTDRLTAMLDCEEWEEYNEMDVSILRKAINKLAGMQKRIMQMIYYDELTQEEVAMALNINQSTVRVHHHRAKENLIKALNKNKR